MTDEPTNNEESEQPLLGPSILASGIENIPAILAAFEKYFGTVPTFDDVPVVAVSDPKKIRAIPLQVKDDPIRAFDDDPEPVEQRPIWYKPVWDERMRVTHEPSDAFGVDEAVFLRGKPYPLRIATASKRVYGKDCMFDSAEVSTVYLGIDHGYSGDPILWETMIFIGGNDPHGLDQDQYRYTNQMDAMINHFALVMKLQALGYVMNMSMDDTADQEPEIIELLPPPAPNELERKRKRNRG